MLTEILELIRRHGRLSLIELTGQFRTDASALEPMMDILIRKGKVRIFSGGCAGGSCTVCSCASRESILIYEAVHEE
jgi:hypothetical protein